YRADIACRWPLPRCCSSPPAQARPPRGRDPFRRLSAPTTRTDSPTHAPSSDTQPSKAKACAASAAGSARCSTAPASRAAARRAAVEGAGMTFIDLLDAFGDEVGVAWFNDYVHLSQVAQERIAALACHSGV